MRSFTVFAVVGFLGANAAAKPLPKGWKSVIDGVPMIEVSGAKIPVAPYQSFVWQTPKEVVLSDDGKKLVVRYESCMMSPSGEISELEVPIEKVEARLENVLGMTVHVKKKYDDAIKHFTAALAKDFEPVYATNLLSAQSLANKLDDAEKTIETYGRKAPGWFAWRFAVDPELKKIKAHTKSPLATAPKHGKVTTKQLVPAQFDTVIAYSPSGSTREAAYRSRRSTWS
jgi:hypothetical protein